MSGIIRVTPAELRDMAGRYNNEGGQVQELVVLQAKRLLLNTKN